MPEFATTPIGRRGSYNGIQANKTGPARDDADPVRRNLQARIKRWDVNAVMDAPDVAIGSFHQALMGVDIIDGILDG